MQKAVSKQPGSREEVIYVELKAEEAASSARAGRRAARHR